MTEQNPNDANCGMLHDGFHTLKERVYFEHTDFSGVVYHARYLDFLEHGRSDYVRLLGVHHKQLNDGIHGESLAFAVYHMDLSFHAAAQIDDVLEIRTMRGVITGPKLKFQQSISRSQDKILSADVTVVLVNREGKPRRFPKSLLQKLGVS